MHPCQVPVGKSRVKSEARKVSGAALGKNALGLVMTEFSYKPTVIQYKALETESGRKEKLREARTKTT